jgi:glycosyltransferase involved in cell wall biosynthesis
VIDEAMDQPAVDTPRPRVLHVVPLPPPQGGMATFAVGMLGSTLRDDYDLIPIRADRINKFRSRGLKRKFANILNLILLTGATLWGIIRYRPKIVHVQSNSGSGFFEKTMLCSMARLSGCKVVMSLHGGGFRDFYNGSSGFKQSLIRRGLSKPHRIICATPRMWETLSLIGTPEERLVLIGNGINPPEQFRRDMTADGEPMRVLFLNRVTIPKGVCELIDAAARVHEEFPNMHVRIAGFPSEDQPEFEARVHDRGVGEYVHFAGGVEAERKAEEYLAADIYVLPSHVEDLPYGMLEAMGYGLPCIASDVGGISTLTAQGGSGMLVEPRNVDALVEAMSRLLGDASLRERLGLAARARIVDEYSWGHRGRQIAELYHELLV